MHPAGESGNPGPSTSFFDAVGGEPTFRKLVDEFYAGVADDPLLRPMYPEEDLGPAAERLTLFLMQYWGGPNTYSAQRGHPRLLPQVGNSSLGASGGRRNSPRGNGRASV